MLQIMPGTNQKGAKLVTTVAISQGTVFKEVTDYQVTSLPTYTSVQMSPELNIEELHLASLNHSCDPNIMVDTLRLELRALRDIAAGEELTFFYPSTEWDMAAPFACLCGSSECLRLVAGARYLSLEVLSRYVVNRHIQAMALECLNTLPEALELALHSS